MGQESTCRLRFEGEISRGTAHLEQTQLLFRGPLRLAIPLKDITSATAVDDRLLVTFGGRTAEFEIGSAAAKWAERITNPPSRIDKLGIKPGMTVLLVALRDSTLREEITRRGARIVRSAPADGADAIFFAASHRDELAGIAALAQSLKPAGALWVVRPKGVGVITEADTMAAGKHEGLVDVKVVSYSDTHTAEKFVIPVAKRAAPSHALPRRGARESASRRGR